MGPDLKQRRLFLILLGLIVIVAGMGFQLRSDQTPSWMSNMLSDSTNTASQVWFRPFGAVYELWEEWKRLRTIQEENEVLRATIIQYANDTARLNDLEAQNERLKKALDFTELQKKQNSFRFRIAEVVGGQSDLYNNKIVINLGAKDHIQLNMAVTTVEGLLGRVVEVSPFYSTVQLLSDMDGNSPQTKYVAVTAKGKESASFGIIERYDLAAKQLIMSKVDQNDPIQLGDIVVTSGLGDVFPRGIVVGKVASKTMDEFGLTYRVAIDPAVDFRRVNEVFVVDVPETR